MTYKFVREQDPSRELKVWEAARATAAAPPYFKPFIHSETMNTYTDGAFHHNCPAAIADHERRLLWQEVSDWPPDMFLSLGTGLDSHGKAPKPQGASSPKPPDDSRSKPPKPHYGSPGQYYNGIRVMWWAGHAIVENLLDSEDSWRKHCARSTPPGEQHGIEEKRRNLRINVGFVNRPKLDDVKDLESIERHVQNAISEDPKIRAEIHEAAHRLIASSFYFEKDKVVPNRAAGTYECSGKSCPELAHG